MKKRILSLLLALVLCFMMLPSAAVLAAQTEQVQTEAASNMGQPFSNWALADLMTGDTYGIIPVSWYELDMTAPITNAQLRVLLAAVRNKLLKTDCVVTANETPISLKQALTVKEVLRVMYCLAADNQYAPELILKNTDYLDYMEKNGIYTGKNGEQSLKDLCSVEQACVIATRLIATIYDQLDAESKGFFYVTKANGNTVYMLGSIHTGSSDMYPLNNDIIKAFHESDALVVEVDFYNQDGPAELTELALYNDGTTLKDHISAETYQELVSMVQAYGLTEEMISLCKPWYLYLQFISLSMTESGSTEEAVQNSSLGIDMNFMNNALLYNKPILEIEGYGYQGRMLDSFSDELEEYLLAGIIKSMKELMAGESKEGSESMEVMQALWKKGEEEAFAKYGSFEYEYKDVIENAASEKAKAYIAEMKEKVFTNRDIGMADYIDGLLQGKDAKTYFVVVGSGHYVSDYDVIDILTKKGYEITQIK
jgi:uncharacterized protein YbaP (TraB family)